MKEFFERSVSSNKDTGKAFYARTRGLHIVDIGNYWAAMRSDVL